MSPIDLNRIPETYRERAQREATEAQFTASCRPMPTEARAAGWTRSDVDNAASTAVLREYMAIADEADAAEAEHRRVWAGHSEVAITAGADAEARAVWARRTAERDAKRPSPHGEHHDCPACVAQTAAMSALHDTDPPPSDATVCELPEARPKLCCTAATSRDILRAIAALLKLLPPGRRDVTLDVSFDGTPSPALDMLTSHGAEVTDSQCEDPPRLIRAARLTVDGVAFAAQRTIR